MILLPLLDEDARIIADRARSFRRGREGSARKPCGRSCESGDSWLVACAVATAAELGLRELRA